MAGFEDEDIGKDIEAAMTGGAPDVPPSGVTTEAPAASPDKTVEKPAGADRARDETGKFVAKEPAEVDKKIPEPSATPGPSPSVASPQPAHTAIPAPPNWKGGGKVEWARLPQAIQKEIADDYTRITQAETELGRYRSVITPERAQALIAETGSVEQGLSRLLAISDIATQRPMDFLQWFAQSRGIDLSQFGQGAQGQQAPDDQNPYLREVMQLRNLVQQQGSTLQNLIQQQTQGAQSQVLSEIDAFSRDPAHPYFNDVREHMGALMKAGKAATLQEAYDMATWAHPDVRKSLLAQQGQQVSQQNAQKVQQAKQASTGSLTGSPAGAKVPADQPETTLEAELARNVGKYFGT